MKQLVFSALYFTALFLNTASSVQNSSAELNSTYFSSSGFSTIEAGNRITGGQDAADGEFPFYARVLMGDNFCGGTIISETEVLTAAHCVYEEEQGGWLQAGSIEVRSGDFTDDRDDEEDRRQIHALSHFSYFEEYKGSPVDGYDEVLLILAAPIVFDSFRQALEPCSETYAQLRDNTLMAVGLGYVNSEKKEHADKLQKVRVSEVSVDICDAVYQGDAPQGSQICTQDGGGKDTCVGDSGGPLFIVGNSGINPVCLYGSTSYGTDAKPCGSGFPSVYARTSFYLDGLRQGNNTMYSRRGEVVSTAANLKTRIFLVALQSVAWMLIDITSQTIISKITDTI